MHNVSSCQKAQMHVCSVNPFAKHQMSLTDDSLAYSVKPCLEKFWSQIPTYSHLMFMSVYTK